MKNKTKYHYSPTSKYDTLSLLLVVIAAIFIVAVFMWFGYKNQQIEQEILKYKK